MALTQRQIDSRIEIITPENIAFQYRVAGPFRRMIAYGVDVLIRFAALMVCAIGFTIVFSSIGAEGLGFAVTLVLWFLLSWFYGGLFETFWNGQTPGKRLMGIRVLATDGQPITALQAVLRNILRAVDSMPVVPLPLAELPIPVPLYVLGLIACSLNERFQRLGDLACGTMVVVEEGQWSYGVVQVNEPAVIELAAQLPPGVAVTRSLARTLSDYVERRRRFGTARQIEIARHLADPLRDKYHLPIETNPDLLLCALYYRAFIADRIDADAVRSAKPRPRGKQPILVSEELEAAPAK